MGVDPLSIGIMSAMMATPELLNAAIPAAGTAMGSMLPSLGGAAATAAPLAPAIGATAAEAAAVPAWTAAGSLPWLPPTSSAPSFLDTLGAAGKQFGMNTLTTMPMNAMNQMRQNLAASQMRQPASFQPPQLQSQAPPTPIFGDMRNLGQGDPYSQFMQNVFSRNPRV